MTSEKEQNRPVQQHSRFQHTLNDDSHLGFFAKLAYRRVPQAIGFYLAGSWTFLEFFESQISRHNISPHWQDISVLVIILLFPTILILAYRHGAPGVQNWTKVEKLGIPSNFIITFLIIFNQFAAKDLGASAEVIKVIGPDGVVIEYERPKEEFRKRLGIAFFDINDKDADKYLALGIPIAIRYDLEQDPYLNVFDPSHLAYELKQSDYRGLKAPLALLLQIAKNNRIEFLAIGNLSKHNGQIILSSSIYKVDGGTLLSTINTNEHNDIFTAVDDLSNQIKSAIGLSGGHINNTPDLPIAEQLTDSMPAFLAYVKSRHEERFNDNFIASETDLKTAIELDESFAIAASEYALVLFRQSRTEEGLNQLKLAKKHNYRLTVSKKFALAAIQELFSANPEAARTVVNQWLELYPDDADAWSMKYSLHQNFNERLQAIEALREMIRIEPFATNRHLKIGKIYTSLGDIESALKEYQIFTTANPTNASGHILIGDSNRALGRFDIAKEEYLQAKLLLTNDITADRKLAELALRQGNFSQSETEIKQYIQSSNLPEDKYFGWYQLATQYWLRGQRSESLNAFRNCFAALQTFKPENVYLFTRANDSWRFAIAGLPQEGQQMIDDANIILQASNEELYILRIKISQAMFDAQVGKIEHSKQLIAEVSQSFKNYVGSGLDSTISIFMGIIYFKEGDYAESAKSLAFYLEQNPINESENMVLMGESLFRSEQIILAKDTFEKVLKEFPSHPLANFGMARVEVNLENPKLAIPYLAKALKGWELADSTFEPANEARKLANQLQM